MKQYITFYKKLPDDWKEYCEKIGEKTRGLYIVTKWTKNLESFCPLNISNFVNVIIRKDINW